MAYHTQKQYCPKQTGIHTTAAKTSLYRKRKYKKKEKKMQKKRRTQTHARPFACVADFFVLSPTGMME